VADGSIFGAPNAVDHQIFAERVEAERADRAALRGRLGLDGCVFLYVGRFERVKGLDVLLRAMRDVPAHLVLIGSGPLEAELRRAAGERIRIVGQLTRDELVPWYAAADVFVLPSRSEPWGMVLNEAAAAGLPLVATDAVGAAHDLIEPGLNGFRVPSEDPGALGEALRALASDDDLRRRAGEHSRVLAERFRPELWSAAVVSAARATARGSDD
jgi:glycosyltransferase involved in cell wall biosynthesis